MINWALFLFLQKVIRSMDLIFTNIYKYFVNWRYFILSNGDSDFHCPIKSCFLTTDGEMLSLLVQINLNKTVNLQQMRIYIYSRWESWIQDPVKVEKQHPSKITSEIIILMLIIKGYQFQVCEHQIQMETITSMKKMEVKWKFTISPVT